MLGADQLVSEECLFWANDLDTLVRGSGFSRRGSDVGNAWR
jgi:hypothetical protein